VGAIRIRGGARTPFGRAKGALASFAPLALARAAAEEALARTETAPDEVAALVLCTGTAANWPPYPARVLGRELGLAPERPCLAVVEDAAGPLTALDRLLARDGLTLIVGAGSASAAIGTREAGRSILDRESTDPDTGLLIGEEAEVIARAHGLRREALDSLAIESHMNAARARAEGVLRAESFGLFAGADWEEHVRDDQGILASASAEKFAAVPAMKSGGTATHANIALPCDGAAALIAGEGRHGALLRRVMVAGARPEASGLAAAVAAVLAAEGVAPGDLQALELHERSAAHLAAALKELGFGLRQKLNRSGGAIALGHVPGGTMVRHILCLCARLEPGALGVAAAAAGGICGAALIEGARR